MEKPTVYCISLKAAAILLGVPVGPDIQEGSFEDIFNWSVSDGGALFKRVKVITERESIKDIVWWIRKAFELKCTPLLLLSENDSQYTYFSEEACHLYLRVAIKEDGDLTNQIINPDPSFFEMWRVSLLHIGEQNIVTKFSPAFWFAFAVAFKHWLVSTTKIQTITLYENDGRLSPFDWALHVAENPISKSHFGNMRETYWTGYDIPSMSMHGFVRYYPVLTMPASGVAIKGDGTLVPLGFLSDDFAWDRYGIKKEIEAINKEHGI